jgi:hypothetical protein
MPISGKAPELFFAGLNDIPQLHLTSINSRRNAVITRVVECELNNY